MVKRRDRKAADERTRTGSNVVPLPWVARRRLRPVPRQPALAPADPDDYPIRDRTLVAIAVFLVLLIGSSLWLLETMRKNKELEECLLIGRKYCAPMIAPLVDR